MPCGRHDLTPLTYPAGEMQTVLSQLRPALALA